MKVSVNWNETYNTISPKLLGICRRYIKDISTAEDIVHDSFIIAIQKQETLKDINAVNGWLSRIVINMAIHHLKNNKITVFSTLENLEIIDNSSTMNTINLENKSRILASDLDTNDVLEAIDSLPEHHKAVFNMYIIDRFSHIDIAKTLEISVGTSKSHLSRARKSIQQFLLNKLKPTQEDKSKKRRIAFLLILGLENSMFGNFYRKSFNNFQIKTKNDFSTAVRKVSFPSEFIGLTKAISLFKIIFACLGFVLFIGTILYFNNSSQKEAISIIKEAKKAINQDVVIKKELDNNTISSYISENSDTNSNDKKNSSLHKKSLLKSKKSIVIVSKDSIKNEPKKIVIIKKQIIIKDTIYVTK